MEDGSNIQRNVWTMGRTYRGMCGGWEEHREECIEGGGQHLTRRFLVCSGPVEGEQGQLLQLTVTVILAFSVEPVSLPEACDT